MQDHPTTPPSLSRLAPPPPLDIIVTPSIKKGKTIMKDQQATGTGSGVATMNGEPITVLILPYIDPMQYPHIKKTLEDHGAVIKKHGNQFHLYFPQGTVKEERFPMVGVPRQKITFPDGWWLMHEDGDHGRLPVIVIDPPAQEEKPE